MGSFVLFIIIGAALAGYYGHRQVGANTARSIADVRSIPIDESDAHVRRARAETIGRIPTTPRTCHPGAWPKGLGICSYRV
jgi:hypothetical protein